MRLKKGGRGAAGVIEEGPRQWNLSDLIPELQNLEDDYPIPVVIRFSERVVSRFQLSCER